MRHTATESNSPRGTLVDAARIWRYLPRKRRLMIVLTLFLIVASSAAELISIASVVPFMSVLIDPASMPQWAILDHVMDPTSGRSIENRQTFIALAFATIIACATSIRICSIWLNVRIAAAIGSDVGRDVFTGMISRPYAVHVSRHSSDAVALTATYVGQFVTAVQAYLQLATCTLMCVAITVAALTVNWRLALVAGTLLGAFYSVLSAVTKNKLQRNSRIAVESRGKSVKIVQEALGAIRQVILRNCSQYYIDRFHTEDRRLRYAQASSTFLAGFPRFALEGIGLITLSLISLAFIRNEGDLGRFLPALAAGALAAQRVMPAMQQVFSSWAQIRSSSRSTEVVLSALEARSRVTVRADGQAEDSQPLRLTQELELESVVVDHAGRQHPALNGLSCRITAGECVGIIGPTGSGKSTLVDVLLGLVPPTSGKFRVDNSCIASDGEIIDTRWRSRTSEVPQDIYLTDGTIAENIGFGAEPEDIDLESVICAAEKADIREFIASLPKSFLTRVGERGLQLSGGQRQRIGIARALHEDCELLILDEATSALDLASEKAVMGSIWALRGQVTIIVVAHRLSTLFGCDRVFSLEAGKIAREFNRMEFQEFASKNLHAPKTQESEQLP